MMFVPMHACPQDELQSPALRSLALPILRETIRQCRRTAGICYRDWGCHFMSLTAAPVCFADGAVPRMASGLWQLCSFVNTVRLSG